MLPVLRQTRRDGGRAAQQDVAAGDKAVAQTGDQLRSLVLHGSAVLRHLVLIKHEHIEEVNSRWLARLLQTFVVRANHRHLSVQSL